MAKFVFMDNGPLRANIHMYVCIRTCMPETWDQHSPERQYENVQGMLRP